MSIRYKTSARLIADELNNERSRDETTQVETVHKARGSRLRPFGRSSGGRARRGPARRIGRGARRATERSPPPLASGTSVRGSRTRAAGSPRAAYLRAARAATCVQCAADRARRGYTPAQRIYSTVLVEYY